jgi:LIVCS family branched-chain amino acid:cation transporter
MNTLNSLRLILTAGFAMFSMFFGSGNLVYPMITGTEAAGQTFWSIAGFVVTAVLLPFLGLLAMILYRGDYHVFLGRLGRPVAFILIFMMLALMGPFGVMPRCITVAYGGIAMMNNQISSTLFSLIFCVITAALIWQRNKIVDIIALFLTPFKFGSIILLIIFGLLSATSFIGEPSLTPSEAFSFGLNEGYQTMDLMAAFFFACTIYEYLRMRLQALSPVVNEKQLFRLSLFSSLLGGGLLSVVYVGFIALGSNYSILLSNIDPEFMLAAIAKTALGDYGMPLVSLTLAVSCLATATVLATLFVDFLQEDICRSKLSRPWSITISMAITFFVSLFGFQTIREILGSILTWIYPFLVAYTLWSIFAYYLDSRNNKGTKSVSKTNRIAA